ncbi:MAG: hypothetical protein AAFV53_35930 [Myxococcota bacterium]
MPDSAGQYRRQRPDDRDGIVQQPEEQERERHGEPGVESAATDRLFRLGQIRRQHIGLSVAVIAACDHHQTSHQRNHISLAIALWVGQQLIPGANSNKKEAQAEPGLQRKCSGGGGSRHCCYRRGFLSLASARWIPDRSAYIFTRSAEALLGCRRLLGGLLLALALTSYALQRPSAVDGPLGIGISAFTDFPRFYLFSFEERRA